MKNRVALLLIGWIGAACGSLGPAPSERPVLAVDERTSLPGDSVTLRLRNDAGQTLGYNLCMAALEERAGSEWIPVATDRVCTMELRILAPDEADAFTVGLPASLRPGEYRFGTSIEWQPSGPIESIFTDPFAVTSSPQPSP